MKEKIKQGLKKSKWSTVITVLLGLWLVGFAVSTLIGGQNGGIVDDNAKIVIIPIKGVIMVEGGGGSPFSNTVASSTSIVKFIEEAENEKSIKAIILDINSPGGTVVGSEEIATAVKNAKKPVVSLIREVGASGGYWVASASDVIVASPMSITGSIGVRGSHLEFSGLMEEYGVSYEQLKAGEFKESGNPYQKMTDKEKKLLQGKIDMMYGYFVAAVAENRDMSYEEALAVADGSFYLGKEAKELGLIDFLGNKKLAINITNELAETENAKIVKFEEKQRLIDLLGSLSTSAFYNIGKGIGAELKQVNVESEYQMMAM